MSSDKLEQEMLYLMMHPLRVVLTGYAMLKFDIKYQEPKNKLDIARKIAVTIVDAKVRDVSAIPDYIFDDIRDSIKDHGDIENNVRDEESYLAMIELKAYRHKLMQPQLTRGIFTIESVKEDEAYAIKTLKKLYDKFENREGMSSMFNN